jgi:hypothetical protein
MDTARYQTSNIQAGYGLNSAAVNYMVQLGYTRQPPMKTITGIALPEQQYIMNQNIACPLAATITAQAGADVSFNETGLLRYGLSLGMNKTFKKQGVTLRATCRGVNYKDVETGEWKPLAGLDLGIGYRFDQVMGKIGF